MIDFLVKRFAEAGDADALVWRDQVYSYRWLLDALGGARSRLEDDGVTAGTVIVLEGDFSPTGVALLLAAVERRCVVIPLTRAVSQHHDEFVRIAKAQVEYRIDAHDALERVDLPFSGDHGMYRPLQDTQHPGLVVFSSGSTGESKGMIHDFSAILDKFRLKRRPFRTITFLLYDHMGGVNTMLHTLSNGGCLVTVQDRSPDAVLSAVAAHEVQLLPTSPSFLNLMLVSGAHRRHDLSTLRLITYGTEPMLEGTLRRLNEALPEVRLQQTYGLSEIGVMRSKSRGNDSLWLKVGGEGFETRVVDGMLQIKAHSAMLGYLNAPSPFTEDGWLKTGDAVEVDGEWLRILGRTSEIINVGGAKVYPAEVESVVQQMSNVVDATVHGEKHALMGQVVAATVRLEEPEEERPALLDLDCSAGPA